MVEITPRKPVEKLSLTGKGFKEILAVPTEEGLSEIGDAVDTMREMTFKQRGNLQLDSDIVPLFNFALLLNEVEDTYRKKPSLFLDQEMELALGKKLRLARKKAGLMFKGKQEGYYVWKSMGNMEIPLHKLDPNGLLDLVLRIRVQRDMPTVTLYMRDLEPVDSPGGGVTFHVSSGAL